GKMTATFPCPKGHASAESDYCDTCGTAIGGAPAEATVVLPSGPAAAPAAGERCPVCSAPRSGSDRFCENDGYDFVSGRKPEPAATAASPTGTAPAVSGAWTASVEADRDY